MTYDDATEKLIQSLQDTIKLIQDDSKDPDLAKLRADLYREINGFTQTIQQLRKNAMTRNKEILLGLALEQFQ